VRSEAWKLEVLKELPAVRARIIDDHGLHLIEKHLSRYATNIVNACSKPRVSTDIARIELQPEQPNTTSSAKQLAQGRRNTAKSTCACHAGAG
jgi:hypothetical protein